MRKHYTYSSLTKRCHCLFSHKSIWLLAFADLLFVLWSVNQTASYTYVTLIVHGMVLSLERSKGELADQTLFRHQGVCVCVCDWFEICLIFWFLIHRYSDWADETTRGGFSFHTLMRENQPVRRTYRIIFSSEISLNVVFSRRSVAGLIAKNRNLGTQCRHEIFR